MSLAALQGANVVARFALELGALAALAYWGFHLHLSTGLRVMAGLVAPLAAAAVWAVFASPKAPVTLPSAGVLAVQAVVFAAAVLALLHTGRPQLAWGLGITAAVNAVLLAWWQQ